MLPILLASKRGFRSFEDHSKLMCIQTTKSFLSQNLPSAIDTTTGALVAVPGGIQSAIVVCVRLKNLARDVFSGLTWRQLMDIKKMTRTQPFVVPFVQNRASPEEEPVDKFLHVLKDTFSHNEMCPQTSDHLSVSRQSECSVGVHSDAYPDTDPGPQSNTKLADGLGELEDEVTWGS